MNTAKIIKSQSVSLQNIDPYKSKIKLICSNKIHLISKADVLYLKSDSNYCEVVLVDGRRIVCSQTLKAIESRLHSNQFYRPHQSYVFNIKYMASVNGNYEGLELEGGTFIPISRSNRADFKKMLESWYD